MKTEKMGGITRLVSLYSFTTTLAELCMVSVKTREVRNGVDLILLSLRHPYTVPD